MFTVRRRLTPRQELAESLAISLYKSFWMLLVLFFFINEIYNLCNKRDSNTRVRRNFLNGYRAVLCGDKMIYIGQRLAVFLVLALTGNIVMAARSHPYNPHANFIAYSLNWKFRRSPGSCHSEEPERFT